MDLRELTRGELEALWAYINNTISFFTMNLEQYGSFMEEERKQGTEDVLRVLRSDLNKIVELLGDI